MNALYRPGPMDYIPDFIDRKHGRKPITYDLPCMERYLKDTYGITVYQEQVMLLSREIADFTRGESDGLRKAMGKKLADKMAELKVKFLAGGTKKGYKEDTLGEDLGRLGKVCQLRLQQEPCYLLQLGRLSDSVPQGELPRRVHGRCAEP